jgi:hypothetical protein
VRKVQGRELFRVPHDIVPSKGKRGRWGDGPRTLSHAAGRSSSRARLSLRERSSGGISGTEGRDPSTWMDRNFGAMRATG